jgi:hypothetical protein
MSGALPTAINPVSATIQSIQPTRVSVSHSLKRQTRSNSVQRWGLSFAYGRLSRAVVMQFYAFLLSQRGQADTFTTILPGHTVPQGTWLGTPVVAGASQTGTSIALSGFTASQFGVAKAGDLLKFAGHTKVYMVTADANSTGTGTATLSIQPALLVSPGNLEAITTSNVPFTVSLASDNVGTQLQAGPLYGLNIDMIEVY